MDHVQFTPAIKYNPQKSQNHLKKTQNERKNQSQHKNVITHKKVSIPQEEAKKNPKPDPASENQFSIFPVPDSCHPIHERNQLFRNPITLHYKIMLHQACVFLGWHIHTTRYVSVCSCVCGLNSSFVVISEKKG
jgi:hypothetical protein